MTGTAYLTTASNSVQLVRGVSKTFSLTVLDEAGDAFDLTGATIWFTVKKLLSDDVVLIQKKSDNGAEVTITDARAGTAEIYLLPDDTYQMEVREYVFDIWVVTSGGDRYLVAGPSTLELQNSVTRI